MRGGASTGYVARPCSDGGESIDVRCSRQPSNHRPEDAASSTREGASGFTRFPGFQQPRNALVRMPPRIQQHVGDRIAHLPREVRPEVVAIVPGPSRCARARSPG